MRAAGLRDGPYRGRRAGERGRRALESLALERLVEERGGSFPTGGDEWTSYLFFLREYAESDGTVPASFDWLIEDEFAELVGSLS